MNGTIYLLELLRFGAVIDTTGLLRYNRDEVCVGFVVSLTAFPDHTFLWSV
jgi:hypothetical protein